MLNYSITIIQTKLIIFLKQIALVITYRFNLWPSLIYKLPFDSILSNCELLRGNL